MKQSHLLGFPDYRVPAERLAKALDIPFLEIRLHHFPDGESQVQLPAMQTDQLIVCRSLDQPNDKLIELMLAARTAREAGIKQLTLVAPYMCYMRQDKAFHPGEAVSQRIIGRYLAELFDNIVTVDPHLHRTPELQSAIPCKQAISLSATTTLGDFLASHNKPYTLIGPDAESQQWVSTIAEVAGFNYGIASKTRFSDTQVEIVLPEMNVQQADVVLVDDMISTGHTMLETARKLFDSGASSVSCLVTHALFNDEVMNMLQAAGIKKVWSTDSIIHDTNIIHLDTLLTAGIRSLTA